MDEQRCLQCEKRINDLEKAVTALEKMEEDVGDIKKVILGNGDAEKSHVIQIDRLTRWAGGMKKFMWVAVVAVVGMLVKDIVHFIRTDSEALTEIRSDIKEQKAQMAELVDSLKKP